MKKLLIFFLLFTASISADAVKLFNDTPFELTALVQSANGTIVAQKNFAPNEQSVWSTDQVSTEWTSVYDSTSSYTPYTVIWRCSYEGYYSVCSDVASGAMVTANSCPGAKYCKPKPKKDKNDQTQDSENKNSKTQNSKKTSCKSCNGKRRIS